MLKSLILSFALPKVMSLYLVEIILLINVFKKILFSIFSYREKVKLAVFRNRAEKIFASIVVIETSFKLSLIVLSSIAIGVLEVEKIAYEIKMFLYFFIFLFMPSNYISRLVGQHIGKITVVHFTISAIIISYSITQHSFQSLLWKANEFGGRFVGFTGSSIGTDGLTLTGSTANSIGILYLLLLVYFQNNQSHYFLKIISVLGVLLSFSQTAFIGLLGYAAVLFLSNIRKLSYWIGLLGLCSIFTIIQNVMDFSVLDRLFKTIEILFTTGKLPGSLLDRYLQLSNVVNLIASCPGALFLGEFYFAIAQCAETTIVESYFFNQLQSFGVFGFSLAFFKFILLVFILNKRSMLRLRYFYMFWFVSNVFMANTFETDFILLTLISLTTYEQEGKFNEVQHRLS
tara:strand:+ start:839 stop:2041 length:1203 start_codon:yes stop_codon:yes gene_type:complete